MVKVAEFFMHEIVRLHGIPKLIVSDRDKVFLSIFWEDLFTRSVTTLRMSSAYHLETDGQIEIVNKTIKQYLQAMIHDNPRTWVELLPCAKLWYNTSQHHSLGTSPFQAAYGWPPREIIDYRSGNSSLEAVDILLQQRDVLLRDLRTHLMAAQSRMKTYVDLK